MDETATVLVIGDSNVGKSTLVKYQRIGTFCDTIIPSVDIELSTFIFPIRGKNLKIFVKDTPGMKEGCLRYERFVIPQFTRCAVIVFVYDKTNRESFDRIRYIKQMVDDFEVPFKEYILVGNKSDDTNNEVITTGEGQIRCTKLNMDFFIETSAKEGTNVDELFYEVALRIIDKALCTEIYLKERGDNKGCCERFCDMLKCLFKG